MIRRPPRSTLFPTRRSSDLRRGSSVTAGSSSALPPGRRARVKATSLALLSSEASNPSRSEEHTSELQSRQYLVCRLLLEKKKKSYFNSLIISSQLLLTRFCQ